MSKSIIFQVKSFLANFYWHLAIFLVTLQRNDFCPSYLFYWPIVLGAAGPCSRPRRFTRAVKATTRSAPRAPLARSNSPSTPSLTERTRYLPIFLFKKHQLRSWCHQCDQIGRFWKLLTRNLFIKVAEKDWCFLGYLKKITLGINWCGYYLGNC